MRSSWDAYCWEEGWTFTWVDERPNLLSDNDELITAMYRELDGREELVSPTGPTVRMWPGDPLAVLIALRRTRPESPVFLSEDAPTVPSTPEGSTA